MTTLNPLQKNVVNVCGNPNTSRSIIFVHGFGTDQSAWQQLVAAFAAEYRIVLLDNVGFGQSDPALFDEYRYLKLAAYADDLLDICTALQLDNAILVGHSLGAMIGVLASLKRATYFSKLVLISASPRYLDDDHYVGGFTPQALDELYREILSNFSDWAEKYGAQAMANPEQAHLGQTFAASIKKIPQQIVLSVLCSIFQADYRQEIAQISHPTLIIQTRADIAVPREVAEYLHRHIKNSQLALIDATGHLPHISAAQEVIRAINGFI